MRSAIYVTIICLLTLILQINCASFNYWEGKRLLDSKQYTKAAIKLRMAEIDSPKDFKPKRDIGISLYYMKQYKAALTKLMEARRLAPKDGATAYYMGRTYEALKEYDEALNEYVHCKDLGAFGRMEKLINQRIQELVARKISAEVRTAIADEHKLSVDQIPANSLAVLYYKNINLWEELTPLEKGLAQMLITDLSKVHALKLVERLKLEKLMQEIQFSTSELYARETTPRLGKLLGARKIIKGGFVSNDEGEIHIITSIVETRSGTPAGDEIHIKGGIHNFFALEKELVFDIVESMGIELSFGEIKAIKETPTKNFLAYMAYLEGIDFEDKGRIEEARRAYKKAIQLDPKFNDAQDRLESTTETTSANEQMITQQTVSVSTRNVEDRLVSTGENIVEGSLPVTTEETTVFRPKGLGTVVIRGKLPQNASRTQTK